MRLLSRWAVLALVCSLIACGASTNTTITPTGPDVLQVDAPAADSCAASRASWEATLAKPSNFCASLQESDLPPGAPIVLVTSSWTFVVPWLNDLYPNAPMTYNVNLTGWRLKNACGSRGAEFEVDAQYLALANPAPGAWLPVWKSSATFPVYSSQTFDPKRPWTMLDGVPPVGSCWNVVESLSFIAPCPANPISPYDLVIVPSAVACTVRPRPVPTALPPGW